VQVPVRVLRVPRVLGARLMLALLIFAEGTLEWREVAVVHRAEGKDWYPRRLAWGKHRATYTRTHPDGYLVYEEKDEYEQNMNWRTK